MIAVVGVVGTLGAALLTQRLVGTWQDQPCRRSILVTPWIV
jgi:hypothetical protein